MKTGTTILVLAVLGSTPVFAAEVVRIESIEILEPQPHASDPAVIWYDAMDEPSSQYFEQKGELSSRETLGGRGRSLEVFYPKGEKGGGSANRKLAFGDCPVGRGKALKRDRTFDDVYWRIYVKHQDGWTGEGPAKMSRAMILNAGDWSQAMISHVWGSGPHLTLDPVRAAEGTEATTTRYNDWDGLKWLGNAPASQFPIHATEEAGRWVCVEARARLNTPGKSDGYNALWIDGIRQCERKDLDFRSRYMKHGINAIFLESYWNQGSPVDQYRWYDDFVVSTKPIGPVVAPVCPTLIATLEDGTWEAEIAVRLESGREGPAGATVEIARAEDRGRGRTPVVGESIRGCVVWRSKPAGDRRLRVDAASGEFVGPRAGERRLEAGRVHFCRSRARGGSWSAWHQPFRTAAHPTP